MARSRFTTHQGRIHHHALRTRHAIRHHGLLTRMHRPVTGGRMPTRHRHRAARYTPKTIRVPHPSGVISARAKTLARQRKTRAASGPKLSHTKIAGRKRVVSTHTRGVHATKPTHPGRAAGPRHLSAEARQHISQALKGKHHPHRGHKLSAETRAKISARVSARLKGRPHPHKGHAITAAARAKISKALRAKPHTRKRATRKRR